MRPIEKKSELYGRLIDAGIVELNDHGLTGFSVRRIAASLGISCATPYKHFIDRDDYVAKIIEHIIHMWKVEIPKIIRQYPDDLKKQLVEVSVSYVKFLVKNSYYRSIIMIKDTEFDSKYSDLRHRLSSMSRAIVNRYATSVDMPEDVLNFKLYVVRSLIYGAALMFDNGEIEYTEENLNYVRRAIDREFDLP